MCWQAETGKYVPSLVLCATFMTIHGVVCGFPRTALLDPIATWSQRQAKALWSRHPFSVSESVRRSIVLDVQDFFRLTSDYMIGANVGASPSGLYS